jgi:hypothetical protein
MSKPPFTSSTTKSGWPDIGLPAPREEKLYLCLRLLYNLYRLRAIGRDAYTSSRATATR